MQPGIGNWRWTLARGLTNLAWGNSSVPLGPILEKKRDEHVGEE